MPPEPALIDIRDACVYRGDTRVFDRLSLKIECGERVAILGPNGAGKSTLLKLVSRELYPAGGRVRILGRERWNVWSLRRRLGIVADDLQRRYADDVRAIDVVVSGFFASVGVHGTLAAEVTAERRDTALRWLREAGVGDCADTPLGRLSTGQRRRCLLARALVHEPDALLLDEPTAGLDLAAAIEHWRRVRRLLAAGRSPAGRSLVIVTHQLADLPPDIDRAILLSGGRVIADGAPQAVLTPATLHDLYGVAVNVRHVDGYHLCWPAGE